MPRTAWGSRRRKLGPLDVELFNPPCRSLHVWLGAFGMHLFFYAGNGPRLIFERAA
jgi:hypothetical protein